MDNLDILAMQNNIANNTTSRVLLAALNAAKLQIVKIDEADDCTDFCVEVKKHNRTFTVQINGRFFYVDEWINNDNPYKCAARSIDSTTDAEDVACIIDEHILRTTKR